MNHVFVWTLNDIVGLIIVTLFLAFLTVNWVATLFEQWRCKHDSGFNETSKCDAICRKCGKNMGFIGKYRKIDE